VCESCAVGAGEKPAEAKKAQGTTTQAGPSKPAPPGACVRGSPGPCLNWSRRAVIATAATDAGPQSYYPLSSLTKAPFPEGIDTKRRELYLSPEDFQRIFKVTKEAFAAYKPWKQEKMKREAGLW
jgi:hypothetical protein